MNTIGVILLAAATATSGIGKPHVFKKVFRHHAVTHGVPPAEGPISAASMGVGGPGGPGGMGAGGGFGENRRFPNVRSQVFFVDPPGMLIGWQSGGGGGADRVYLPAQLTVPARYNFMQGYIYRLKLTNIPGRPGLNLYPTVEVAPSTPATDAFLTHNPIPVQFTEEDFDQVTAGNFVTKVVYLPDPKYQELAIAGVETLVATRLEPGVDPIQEADRRGTILMVIRLGAIDLEMPSSGGSTAVAPDGVVAPEDFVPPGATPYPDSVAPPVAPMADPAVPVDPSAVPPTAPPTPAPVEPSVVPDVPTAPAVPEAPAAPVAPPAPEVPAAPTPETAGLPPLDAPVAIP